MHTIRTLGGKKAHIRKARGTTLPLSPLTAEAMITRAFSSSFRSVLEMLTKTLAGSFPSSTICLYFSTSAILSLSFLSDTKKFAKLVIFMKFRTRPKYVDPSDLSESRSSRDTLVVSSVSPSRRAAAPRCLRLANPRIAAFEIIAYHQSPSFSSEDPDPPPLPPLL